MIGAQSGSTGMDARGSEPMAGDESEGPMTQTSLEAKSVFGSTTNECAASVMGLIHAPSEGTMCSGLILGATAGAISRILFDGRSKSCPS